MDENEVFNDGLENVGNTLNVFGHYTTRRETELMNRLATKDGEIALLKADNYTDKKLVDVYTVLNKSINELEAKMNCKFDGIQAQLAQQAVWNSTQSGMLAMLKNQVDELMHLTVRRVPNHSVCPGWGPVNVEVPRDEP